MSMIFYVFTGVLLALLMYNIGIPMILRLPNNINTMLLNYRMRKWQEERERNSLAHIEQCRGCKYCDYLYDKEHPVPEMDKSYSARGNYGVSCRYDNPFPYNAKYIEDPEEHCEHFKAKEAQK